MKNGGVDTMKVYENDAVKVNIKPRFDFDSYQPVQGIVRDEEREQAITRAFHWGIINAAAISVFVLGLWTFNWWTFGGYTLATGYVAKHMPALWILAKYGIFSG